MSDFSNQIVAIDTNILIRFFVADDENQYQKSANLLEQVAKFVVPTSVFVEIVWVLSDSYHLSKDEILTVLQDFIENSEKLVGNYDEVKAGLDMLAINGDFADGINQFLGNQNGGQVFVTFDKKAVNKLTILGHKALLLK